MVDKVNMTNVFVCLWWCWFVVVGGEKEKRELCVCVCERAHFYEELSNVCVYVSFCVHGKLTTGT